MPPSPRNPIACVILAALTLLTPTRAASELKATGILQLDNQAFALFEESLSHPSPRTFHLAVGEASSLSNGEKQFSPKIIAPADGTVLVGFKTSNHVFTFKSPLANGPGLILQDASINQVIATYSRFARKNILPHPKLPAPSFTFTTQFADKPAGADILRKKLNEAEVALIPFSDTFELAVPQSMANLKVDRSKFLKPVNPAAKMEAGTLEVFGIATPQLLDICANMLKPDAQTLDGYGAENLRHEIRLVTSAQTEEVTDAFQLLFQWQGLHLVLTQEGKFSLQRAQR